MGTASAIPESNPESGSRRGTALFLRKTALTSMKDRLLEARAPAEKRLPPEELKALNGRLWDAFMSKNADEMLRLIRAGANPTSIERRLEREIVNCQY
jgi:hypothetical protein